MRVLLIEGDVGASQSIELALKSQGMQVYATDLGEEGCDLARLYGYQVIVLGQPADQADLTTLRHLRAARLAVPVIVLSEKVHVETTVQLLDAGADDVLPRPFHRAELIARILAVVRRSAGAPSQVIEVGPITLDLSSKAVKVGGVRIHLTGKEYMLLEALALRPGHVMSKDGLLNHLYGGMDEPEIKIVDVFICKIRKKLAEFEADQHLETAWGRGYRLVAEPEVRRAPAAKPHRGGGGIKGSVLALIGAGACSFPEIVAAFPDAAIGTLRGSVSLLISDGVVENCGRPLAAVYRTTSAAVEAA